MSQHHSINGAAESLAVTQWDELDVSSADFEPKTVDGRPHPFYINNVTDTTLFLEVIPLHGSSVVNTPFRPDWNPMQVKCVKQDPSAAGNFLWGR